MLQNPITSKLNFKFAYARWYYVIIEAYIHTSKTPTDLAALRSSLAFPAGQCYG
jgi:hypothetical protein